MEQTHERTALRITQFWSRVSKLADSECWPWTGASDHLGYGRFSFYGVIHKAHRLAWKFTFGEPGNLHVCHRCDNPPCCNHAHLFLGTHADNMGDAKRKGRFATKSKGNWCPGHVPLRGEEIGNHKITEAIVRDIRGLYACKAFNMQELSDRFQLSIGAVFKIVRGKIWTHVGGPIAVSQRLSPDQVNQIQVLYAQGNLSMAELGKQFGISAQSIFNAVHKSF